MSVNNVLLICSNDQYASIYGKIQDAMHSGRVRAVIYNTCSSFGIVRYCSDRIQGPYHDFKVILVVSGYYRDADDPPTFINKILPWLKGSTSVLEREKFQISQVNQEARIVVLIPNDNREAREEVRVWQKLYHLDGVIYLDTEPGLAAKLSELLQP